MTKLPIIEATTAKAEQPETDLTDPACQSSLPHPGLAVLIAILLAMITAAVYWPVRQFDFVNFDDPDYVAANARIQGGLTLANATWAFTTFYAGHWAPITALSHMLDCSLYGLKPGAHHVTSVFVHAANTLLLFWVLRRMTRATWRSAFVAALFGWHPLHVESVAWISERKDVLSAFFFVLTLWAYTRYAYLGTDGQKRSGEFKTNAPRPPSRFPIYYWLALAFFALGLMSKPTVVTLPFVLLLLDYWPLNRTARNTFLTLFREKLPFFALTTGACLLTFYAEHQWGSVRAPNAVPILFPLMNAISSYAGYLHKMIWPDALAVFYPYPGSFETWRIVSAVALLALLSGGAALTYRLRPYLAVGWLWYVGTLVPVIGLVQVGDQAMADRYTYIPLIGVFLALAWGGNEILVRWRTPRIVRGLVMLLPLLGCLLATANQVRYWRNSETLFRHAVKVTGRNYLAYNNLGVVLEERGDWDQARECYTKASTFRADYPEAHYNLARVLAHQGQPAEAARCLRAALRVKPDYAEAHNNLGVLLQQHGQLEHALEAFTEALSIKPGFAEAHFNRGVLLEKRSQPEEARNCYTEALRFKPDYAEAHYNLGVLLQRDGRLDEAMGRYTEALRFNAAFAPAHYNLGIALERQGKLDQAISSYSTALKLKPDYGDAHLNLGLLFARRGKLDEAIEHFHDALGQNTNSVPTLNNLGRALTKRGRAAEALPLLTRSIQLQPSNDESHCNLGNAYLALNQSEQAAGHYHSALMANPNNLEALNPLAWMLATASESSHRDGNRALELALRAVEVTRTNDPAVLDTLAAAYAEAGRFTAAVATAKQAVALAKSSGTQTLADEIEPRLRLYEQSRAFRELPAP